MIKVMCWTCACVRCELVYKALITTYFENTGVIYDLTGTTLVGGGGELNKMLVSKAKKDVMKRLCSILYLLCFFLLDS